MSTDLIINGSVVFGVLYVLWQSVLRFFRKESRYDRYILESETFEKKLPAKTKEVRRWPIRDGDLVVCVDLFRKRVRIGGVKQGENPCYAIVLDASSYTHCGKDTVTDRIPCMMVLHQGDPLSVDSDPMDALSFILSEAAKYRWDAIHNGVYKR